MNKKQEPVAWLELYKRKPNNLDWDKNYLHQNDSDYDEVPLYTHPKEWQGLSDDEITEFVLKEFGKNLSELLVFQAMDIIPIILKLEQKLKEKNT